jgi:hypothetical protein
MKTQKLIKINMMKKENKSKVSATQSSKKVWVKVDKVQEMINKIGMMKIFDEYSFNLFKLIFKIIYYI